jgi:MFS family permease
MDTLRRHALLIIVLGSLVISLAMGLRHGFGLFLEPMSTDLGWGREVFAFALALQNLIWGLAQPFTGALADRFGAARIIVVGGLLYALGLVMMGTSDSALGMSLSAGLLIGLGLSGTTFSVIIGAVGRTVAPEKRSLAMGIVSAAGSFGQFAMLPGTLGLLQWLGWSAALLVMGGLAALMVPLGGMLRDRPSQATCHWGQHWTRPPTIVASGCFAWASSSVASRWCSSPCICQATCLTTASPCRWAAPCWRWWGYSTSSAPTPRAGWAATTPSRDC